MNDLDNPKQQTNDPTSDILHLAPPSRQENVILPADVFVAVGKAAKTGKYLVAVFRVDDAGTPAARLVMDVMAANEFPAGDLPKAAELFNQDIDRRKLNTQAVAGAGGRKLGEMMGPPPND
jgi:hypothetical protein